MSDKGRTQYEEDLDLIPEEKEESEQLELPFDVEEEDEDSFVPSFDDWPYDEPLRFAPFGVD